jgi:tyrosine-specific transport protein
VAAIPLLKEELSGELKKLKKAILWGSIIPIIIYTTFGLVAVGVIGLDGFNALPVDERIASAAIHSTINGLPGLLLDVFAVLAMGTSFLASGLVMKKVYMEDFKLHKQVALLLTLGIPFIIFLVDVFADITNFISIVGLVGGILGSITGMLVVLMYHKARVHSERMPEYALQKHVWFSYVLVAVFVGGLAYQLFSVF